MSKWIHAGDRLHWYPLVPDSYQDRSSDLSKVMLRISSVLRVALYTTGCYRQGCIGNVLNHVTPSGFGYR
jgi:hypothetical protein